MTKRTRVRDKMHDPFGKWVDSDVAIKRWRSVANVIRCEMGFGRLHGFDPGMSFWRRGGSGIVELSREIFVPLYHMCVEARRLRREAGKDRSRALQRILDDGKKMDRNRERQDRIDTLLGVFHDPGSSPEDRRKVGKKLCRMGYVVWPWEKLAQPILPPPIPAIVVVE